MQMAEPSFVDDGGDSMMVQAIRDAMPLEPHLRGLPSLLSAEWDAPVLSYPQLSAQGGISLVPKAAVPIVITSVGFTAQPTAILIPQSPGLWDLALTRTNRVRYFGR